MARETAARSCGGSAGGEKEQVMVVETVAAPLSTVWHKAHARILRNLTFVAFRDVTTLCIE